MSNLFASPNAINPGHSLGGLRQRHSAPTTGFASRTEPSSSNNENSHPNNSVNGIPPFGKWGGENASVRAPPRASLANAGKSAFMSMSGATAHQRQSAAAPSTYSETNQQALAIISTESDEHESSLWVVAYGFRNEAHFRALLYRLESCGGITSRRGGLSNVRKSGSSDDGNNWVAIRFESPLAAQKALCQDGSFVSVGGSTMVIGVMALSDSAAKLGININGTRSNDATHSDTLAHELNREEDIMLCNGGDDTVKSGLDSLCGKVLAWFFLWE